MTEKEIAKQLTDLINKNIKQVKNNDEKWKRHYGIVLEEIESEIRVTKEIIGEFTESNLTINRVEQEGYLRGLIVMLEKFRYWEKFD